MSTYIWKPSTINSWKGGIAFLAPSTGSRNAPTITANGKTYTGKYINTNEGRHQWVFPSSLAGMSDLQISYDGQTGTIASGSTSYEGSGVGNWAARAKGSLGAGGSYGSDMFAPGSIGFGAYPANMLGYFPTAQLASYDPIETAPYKFTDPAGYMSEYGEAARAEYKKNAALSKEMSLDYIDTELQGLRNYAPAAAALKREFTSIDNLFNQAQRTKQLDSTMPGMRASLAAQTDRANTFASGRLTSDIEDRALELGVRSASADNASAGGFGASSSVARKASDLLSAKQRLELSQYGDQLLSNNAQLRTNIEMAPTEYTDAGSQIKVTPTISGSQLQQAIGSELNQASIIPASTALSSTVGQNQFTTNLEQTTRQFNAGNQLALSQFNATAQNQFAMDKFNYMVGYAGTLAGAAQTNINTQLGLDQQQAALDQMKKSIDDARKSGNWGAVGTILGSLFGIALAGELVDYLKGDTNKTDTTTNTETTTESGTDNTPEANGGYTNPDGSIGNDTETGGSSGEIISGNQSSTNPDENGVVTTPDSYDYGYSDATSYSAKFAKNYSGVTTNTDQDRVASMAVQQALNIAGITTQALPGYVHVSTDSEGNKYYANPAMLADDDPSTAITAMQAVYQALVPLKVMTNAEAIKFQKMIGSLTDKELFSKLDAAKASGNRQAFIDALTEAYK